MTEFDETLYRRALGHFVTGVTVVTTMTPQGPLGITANSFSSVSLDPPLVLWSPARKSSRFPAFEAAEYFAIHVLCDAQKDLSKRFAISGYDFEGLDYEEGLGRAPVFPGCAARFECRHSAGHDGGDHLIMVGEVLRLEEAEKPPLVYYRGAYAGLTDG